MAGLKSPARTPSSPKRKRKDSSDSPSPRKSPKKSVPSKPEPVPPSQWRASSVPENKRLPKGECKSRYKLSDKDLQDLEYTTVKTCAGYVSKLYLERAVERVAWEKHGGPDAFEAYIEKRHAIHSNRGSESAFMEPEVDHIGGSLDPSGLKLMEKAYGDQWLLDRCELALFEVNQSDMGPSPTFWRNGLKAAVRDLPNYPRRSNPPANPSSSFTALYALLSNAPKREAEGPNMMFQEDNYPRQDERHYFWSRAYITKIFEALIDIIRAHGVGDDGWRAARWLVYDKYTESINGIHYEELRHYNFIVEDDAYGWLQPRVPKGRKMSLDFALYDKDNHPPAIWKEYNKLLPDDL